jgi:hypothetical protein
MLADGYLRPFSRLLVLRFMFLKYDTSFRVEWKVIECCIEGGWSTMSHSLILRNVLDFRNCMGI